MNLSNGGAEILSERLLELVKLDGLIGVIFIDSRQEWSNDICCRIWPIKLSIVGACQVFGVCSIVRVCSDCSLLCLCEFSDPILADGGWCRDNSEFLQDRSKCRSQRRNASTDDSKADLAH